MNVNEKPAPGRKGKHPKRTNRLGCFSMGLGMGIGEALMAGGYPGGR